MSKNTSYKFTIKDFFRYVLNCWLVLVICAVLGALVSVYSYKKQVSSYTSTATILVHDNSYEFGGSISPYSQIASILASKKAYEDAGVKIEDVSFGDIQIEEKTTGTFELKDSNSDKEKAKSDLEVLVNNAEKVIAKAYNGEKEYRVTVLTEAGEPIASKTQKERILSSAIIFAASIIVAIVIDFVAFNKRAA